MNIGHTIIQYVNYCFNLFHIDKLYKWILKYIFFNLYSSFELLFLSNNIQEQTNLQTYTKQNTKQDKKKS